MATIEPVYEAPVIPSKWDIIPIHNSDRGKFKDCRRAWDFSSPARQNLTLRADVHGVYIPLWFGTGIHWALEQYYTPGLQRDPVEAWKTWFDIQWRGGIVTKEWLDRVYDLRPKPVESVTPTGQLLYADNGSPEQLWTVRGLAEIIPSPDHDAFDEHYELGIQMMEFYKEYAEKNDDFTVLMTEHDFSVPIWDYENDCILTAIDAREDSPNYGKKLEVHARGRQDMLLHRNGAARLGIMDHKTSGRWDDELAKLDTDEQCTTYLAVAQIEANYYDLPHKGQAFEEVVYNVLRKAYPKPPTALRNGMFSVDRQNESTTYDMLTTWIAKNMPGIPLTEKQREYLSYLRDVGDEQFIIRRPVRRNRHQLINAMRRMHLEALDMLSEPRIYPNITNDWGCMNCVFRPPCMAIEAGDDWEYIIEENYSSNRDR